MALRALEDAGYATIDNLPLSLLRTLLSVLNQDVDYLAVVCDVRSWGFSPAEFLELLADLRADATLELQLLFLACDEDVLLRRFKETRRPHPLASDRPLPDGIKSEVLLLQPLREVADVVMDSTASSASALQLRVQEYFAPERQIFAVNIISFSYKLGLPREADLVIDVRFLQNPHYIPELRDFTGRNKAVEEYVTKDVDFSAFYNNLLNLLSPLLPRYRAEGKSSLTLAIGCTGGKHRSVCVAEKLTQDIAAWGVEANLRHRDINIS